MRCGGGGGAGQLCGNQRDPGGQHYLGESHLGPQAGVGPREHTWAQHEGPALARAEFANYMFFTSAGKSLKYAYLMMK